MKSFKPGHRPLRLRKHLGKAVLVPEYIPWDSARCIMRENCFGPRDVLESIHVCFSQRELEIALQVPFSERTLSRCCDSHALFFGVSHEAAGTPLTIAKMHQIFRHDRQDFQSLWYRREGFAAKVVKTGWYLVALSVTKESRKEDFAQQERLLKPNEYRGPAVLYSYLMFMMQRVHSRQVLEHDFAWCSDLASAGYHVLAGGNGALGPQILQGCLDNAQNSHVGLVPVVRPEIQ